MQVLPISYQKYYIKLHLEICNEFFTLTALIDTGSDINLLHKDKIPAKYWAQVLVVLLDWEIMMLISNMKYQEQMSFIIITVLA
jgi:hypothetical protein